MQELGPFIPQLCRWSLQPPLLLCLWYWGQNPGPAGPGKHSTVSSSSRPYISEGRKALPCLQLKYSRQDLKAFGTDVTQITPLRKKMENIWHLTPYSLLSQLLLRLSLLRCHPLRSYRCWLTGITSLFQFHLFLPIMVFAAIWTDLYNLESVLSNRSVWSPSYRWGSWGSQRFHKWITQDGQAVGTKLGLKSRSSDTQTRCFLGVAVCRAKGGRWWDRRSLLFLFSGVKRDHRALQTAAAAQPVQPWPSPALCPGPTWYEVEGQNMLRGKGSWEPPGRPRSMRWRMRSFLHARQKNLGKQMEWSPFI